jgi:hypothetical protein
MNAFVFGGYTSQMRGKWAGTLRDAFGIEVAHACCADDGYKGMPQSDLPEGVNLVLVVAGSCSHKISDRAKMLAQRANVRCETVSKDTARTINWLARRGYKPVTQIETPEPKQEEQVPIVYNPAPVAPEPAPTPAPDPDTTEWLDAQQAKALLPDISDGQFYDLVREVVRREPRKEFRRREEKSGKATTRSVMVWTLDEVEQMDRFARARNWGRKVITDPLVSDPPVTFDQVFSKYIIPPPPVVDEMADFVRAADALVAARTSTLAARVSELQAENDALKAQLERIKAALGV